tara:strand:+ start:868 stop:1224 length:357 start_codon:yes stop_codon:yes gene_type:complete
VTYTRNKPYTKPLANIKNETMKETQDELKELLFKIDLKRDFGEYTMTELQKIAEKAIRVIKKYDSKSDSISELNEAIKISNECHKERSYKDVDNIMDVLRGTKFAIESFLYKEFGIEI